MEWFVQLCVPEPHGQLLRDEAIDWATEVPVERYVQLWDGGAADASLRDPVVSKALLDRVTCPALLMHGTADFIPITNSEAIADRLGAEFVAFEGTGHAFVNDKVRMNEEIRRFAESFHRRPRRQTHRRSTSRRRVLYASSPIGLGHARRDLAVADELRKLRPDVEIDWLTQSPVTELLEHHGERVHPMATHLASESAVIEDACGEHDLRGLDMWRDLGPTLLHNFMVFRDLVTEDHYDLWVGDESWELDYLLRKNPEMKQAPFAWFTDFVGVLPMDEDDEWEAFRVHDYNAEMVEELDRFPSLRDRAIFVGDPEDVIDAPLGPQLPGIRAWTETMFDFAGFVSGFTPLPEGDRPGLKTELGYRPDERLCIVTVGGTGVGRWLLERVLGAHEQIRRLVPDLRMVLVTGPRLDPAALPDVDGVDKRAFVPDLHRHLSVCDVAIIQGGLTTSMELVANRRPFLYFPLRNHFEQNFHVPHRLDRYRAGRRMDYATAAPDLIAHAVADELQRPIDYLPVSTDGAARAAASLADLL
jgi:predicted glycosyltransferase